jgi:hypothetical protein
MILSFGLCLASAARAQVTGIAPPTNAGDPFGEAKERRSRETNLRSITMIGANKQDPREQQALLEQMNHDFKQIQMIRLSMVQNIAAGKSFEYKQLASEAAEIKKRAARLKTTLALRQNSEADRKEPEPVEYEADSIQNAASDLCLEISRFTTNPLFNVGAVYNVRYANEADKTLETIIDLSESIKSSADKLRHSTR